MELVTFTDPQRDLPPIDRLEGFRPGGHSMYQRVMVAAGCRNASIAVWIYRMARVTNGERIDREWRGEWVLALMLSAAWMRLLISSSVKLASLI